MILRALIPVIWAVLSIHSVSISPCYGIMYPLGVRVGVREGKYDSDEKPYQSPKQAEHGSDIDAISLGTN